MALPASIGYCTVTGRFIRTLLDGPDPDREPDTVPIPGLKIEIKADLAKPSLRHGPSKTTILLDTITVTTNLNGDLVGADLVEGIKVIAGDNPELGIFTYTATISGATYARQTLTFDAPTGGTRDLSDLVEVPAAPGATLTAWLEAKNTTLAARDEVLAALDAGGTGGSIASVNGKTGTVVLTFSDVGAQAAGSYATTSSLSSYATTSSLTTGLAGKQASGDYATNTALTSGLAGKQATGDYATNAAVAAKAPLASPAFTGTPTGITKTHVGLSNVDNTTDAAKPISTATATALTGKVGSDGTILQAIKLTQAEYDAIGTKSATTLYVIVG